MPVPGDRRGRRIPGSRRHGRQGKTCQVAENGPRDKETARRVPTIRISESGVWKMPTGRDLKAALELGDNLSHLDAVEADIVGQGGVPCHLDGRSVILLSLVKSEAHPLSVLRGHEVSGDDPGRLLH